MDGSGSPRRDRTRYLVAAIAALVGLVWALQGAGVLPGSVMSGDPLWLWLGLILIAVALAYGVWPRLRRR